MENEYFDGLNKFNKDDTYKMFVTNLASNNNYDYLETIIEYPEKNGLLIGDSINFKRDPLKELLGQKHCSKEWINLLIKSADKCDVKLSKTILEYGITEIKKRSKNPQWKQVIEEYIARAHAKGY